MKKRHLLKENSRALEPVLPRTNDAPHSKSTNERNIRFYSNYELDETGTYTFTIGMPVSSLEDVPETMTTLTIPAATYAVFTTRKTSC